MAKKTELAKQENEIIRAVLKQVKSQWSKSYEKKIDKIILKLNKMDSEDIK